MNESVLHKYCITIQRSHRGNTSRVVIIIHTCRHKHNTYTHQQTHTHTHTHTHTRTHTYTRTVPMQEHTLLRVYNALCCLEALLCESNLCVWWQCVVGR